MSRRQALALFAGVAWTESSTAQASTPISLVLKDGSLASGPHLVKLKRDDVVVLTVVADRADELHLHGYDLHLALQVGQPATLKFVAKLTGRFTLESHKSGVQLSVFEIYPK